MRWQRIVRNTFFFESPPAAKPVSRGEIRVETGFVAKMLMLTQRETKK